MTKPGPEPGTEFVDEMGLALPSIVQVGDTEFVYAKEVTIKGIVKEVFEALGKDAKAEVIKLA